MEAHPHIDQMARAIFLWGRDTDCLPPPWDDVPDDAKARLYSQAKAAAKVLIEEAVKLAEGWEWRNNDGDETPYQTCGNGKFWDAGTAYDQGRIEAATAIRALRSEMGIE